MMYEMRSLLQVQFPPGKTSYPGHFGAIYLGTWEPDLGPGGHGISVVYGRNPLQMGHVCNHFCDTNGILASGFDNPMFSLPESCKEAHCIWNSVGKPPRLRFPCPCAPPPLEATALCRRSAHSKRNQLNLSNKRVSKW